MIRHDTSQEPYNADTRTEEVECAIYKLRKRQASGPDGFVSELLKNGGDNLRQAILNPVQFMLKPRIFTNVMERGIG